MNEPEPLHQPSWDLIDDYLDSLLDEAQTAELEALLLANAAARHYFVRYARLHTDLHMQQRAREASQRVLGRIEQMSLADSNKLDRTSPSTPGQPGMPGQPRMPGPRLPELAEGGHRRNLSARRAPLRLLLGAACVLLLALGTWLLVGGDPGGTNGVRAEPSVAWLVNAQNCQWEQDIGASGDMQAGKVLTLERGLAEVHFQCGARVVLEGPASLALLSGRSASLAHGKLTAKVPKSAVGFEIVSPQGKVVDLGTEFGISVASDGATKVHVFEGKVEAHPADHSVNRSSGDRGSASDQGHAGVSVTENQTALMAGGKVTLNPIEVVAETDGFVRAIVPPPVIVKRSVRLRFDDVDDDSLRDVDGLGIGFKYRLPGTGSRLPRHDPNLRLDPSLAQLELTTTRSDINNQVRLSQGEYLGFKLSDLGFTGTEDFAVTATIPNTPDLEDYGQFGLYAGTKRDQNIRGGLIKWGPKDAGENTQFLVNNNGGRDTDVYKIGLLSPGTDLRLTLERTAGKYSLAVENLTEGGASTLTIRHPEFLDGQPNLHVGLFGANPYSDERKTIVIKEFSVTVWTVAPIHGVE